MRLDLPRICFVTTVGQAREEIELAPIHNDLAGAVQMKLIDRSLKFWHTNPSGAQSTVVEEIAPAPIHNALGRCSR